LIPLIVIVCVILIYYGTLILFALTTSLGGYDHNVRLAVKKITSLMVCNVAGFIVMAIGICFENSGNRTISVVMANMWVREFAALWMLVCIFSSLNIHRPAFATRKTSSDIHTTSKPAVEVEDTSPSTNLEVLRKESESPEAGNV